MREPVYSDLLSSLAFSSTCKILIFHPPSGAANVCTEKPSMIARCLMASVLLFFRSWRYLSGHPATQLILSSNRGLRPFRFICTGMPVLISAIRKSDFPFLLKKKLKKKLKIKLTDLSIKEYIRIQKGYKSLMAY